MEDEKIIALIDKTLNEKIKEDSNFIRYKFFELKIQYNLTDNEIEIFLKLATYWLSNHGYKVFFTGEKYNYKNKNEVVQDNELLIAIKNII